MLARPKPPAQVRRASKEAPARLSFPPEDDTDLPELLIRADGLIRERERELSFTSELSRELKQTHEAFVAKTPLASPSSFVTLPLSSDHSWNLSSPSQKLHDLHSGQAPPARSTFGQARHTRRISITQSELARLSDQNTELLQKLEQLEAESSLADKAGKRRLNKLESEIQTLRNELDQARQDVSERINEDKRTDVRTRRKRDTTEEETKLAPTFQDFAPSSSIPSLSNSHYHSSSSSSLQSELPSVILSHLLSKISELEEANVQICRDHRETSGRLREAQSEVEAIRKVWSYLDMATGTQNDEGDSVDIEIVDDHQDLDEERETVCFRSLRQDILSSLSYTANSSGSSILSRSGPLNSLRSIDIEFEEGIEGEMHSTLRSTDNRPLGRRSVKGNGKSRKSLVGLFSDDNEESCDIGSDSLDLNSTQGSSADRRSSDPIFSPNSELSELDWSFSRELSRSFDTISDDESSPLSELGPSRFRRRTLGSEMGDFSDYFSHQQSRNSSLVQEIEESYEHEHFDDNMDKNDSDSGDEETQNHQSVFPASASIRITPPTPVKNCRISSYSSSESSTASATTSAFSPFPSTPELSSSSSLNSPVQSTSKAETAKARRILLSRSVKARSGRWGPRLDRIFTGDQAKPDSISGFGIREELSAKLSQGLECVFGSQAVSNIDKDPISRSRPSSGHPLSEAPSGQPEFVCGFKSPHHDSSSDIAFASSTSVVSSKSSAEAETPRKSSTSSNSRSLIRSPPSSVERARSLLLEAWLWLHLLLVLGVFIWAVAKKGPRGVLNIDDVHNVTCLEQDEVGAEDVVTAKPNDSTGDDHTKETGTL